MPSLEDDAHSSAPEDCLHFVAGNGWKCGINGCRRMADRARVRRGNGGGALAHRLLVSRHRSWSNRRYIATQVGLGAASAALFLTSWRYLPIAGALQVASGFGRLGRFMQFIPRPVIAGFNEGRPGYGTEGLLSDLNLNRPAIIALQQRDWAPDVADSASFFMSTPSLAGCIPSRFAPTISIVISITPTSVPQSAISAPSTARPATPTDTS